jgi:hypothetical protein
MSEKNIKARIVHKHDVEANWQLATGFTPMTGEIIVYDIDENYSYVRFKIGDGIHNVNELPFAVDNITADDLGVYVQDIEPVNAVVGDIWIDTANDPSYIPPTIPEITEADNGKVLMVVNGKLQLVNLNLSVDTNGVISI